MAQVSGSTTCFLNVVFSHGEKLVILWANHASSCTRGFFFLSFIPLSTFSSRWFLFRHQATNSFESHLRTPYHQAFQAVTTSSKLFLCYFEIVSFHSPHSQPPSRLRTHKRHIFVICVCAFPNMEPNLFTWFFIKMKNGAWSIGMLLMTWYLRLREISYNNLAARKEIRELTKCQSWGEHLNYLACLPHVPHRA